MNCPGVMKINDVAFQSSKIFVTAVTLLSLLRELPIPSDLLWIPIGMSPILHNHSTVSWVLIGFEVILVVGLWIRGVRRFVDIVASGIAGIGVLSASLVVILSHVSSCGLLPAGMLPEVLLAQKVLFAGAVAISVKRSR